MLHPRFARDREAVRRFLAEAEQAGSTGHPHIAAVMATGRDTGGAPLVVREYMEGESLDAVITREGPLPVPEAIRIARQILDGLAAAHTADVANLDLSPGDVFLVDEGGRERQVKLVDFGEAHLKEAVGGEATERSGPYFPPERTREGLVDEMADLWATACMLHQLLTGDLPFGESPDWTGTKVRSAPGARASRKEVDRLLEAVLLKALAVDSERRYPDAASFEAALARASGDRPSLTPSMPPPAPRASAPPPMMPPPRTAEEVAQSASPPAMSPAPIAALPAEPEPLKPSTAPAPQPATQPSQQPVAAPATAPAPRPSQQPVAAPATAPATAPAPRPSQQPVEAPAASPAPPPSQQPAAAAGDPAPAQRISTQPLPATQAASRPSQQPAAPSGDAPRDSAPPTAARAPAVTTSPAVTSAPPSTATPEAGSKKAKAPESSSLGVTESGRISTLRLGEALAETAAEAKAEDAKAEAPAEDAKPPSGTDEEDGSEAKQGARVSWNETKPSDDEASAPTIRASGKAPRTGTLRLGEPAEPAKKPSSKKAGASVAASASSEPDDDHIVATRSAMPIVVVIGALIAVGLFILLIINPCDGDPAGPVGGGAPQVGDSGADGAAIAADSSRATLSPEDPTPASGDADAPSSDGAPDGASDASASEDALPGDGATAEAGWETVDATPTAATAPTSPTSPGTPPTTGAPRINITIRATPPGARITLDGQAVSNPHSMELERSQQWHDLRAEADGYVPQRRRVRFLQNRTIPLTLIRRQGPVSSD